MIDRLRDSCIDERTTIKEAMRIIDNTEKKTIFVMRDNYKLLGVVNDGDIRRAILSGINPDISVLRITNRDPITDIDTAKQLIRKTGMKNLLVPIVDDEHHLIDCKVVTAGGVTKKKYKKQNNRILVIGGAGYLGSVLCEKLLRKGYRVRVLDNLMYGDIGIQELYKHPNFEFVYGDMRDLQILVDSIKEVDSVIHLAAIVGDPACDLDPDQTIKTNYFATKMVGEICKFSQINRLIFASTCSVYGASSTKEDILTEQSQTNPVSLYAEMKLKSEKGLLEIADDNFKPTIFRMATLHGVSPKMRFDLVVNILSIKAIIDNKIDIWGGNQHRAFCHIDYAADAYIKCLETPLSKVGSEIFNIVTENMSINELGNKIINRFPGTIKEVKEVDDNRDYMVSGIWAKSTMELDKGYTVIDTMSDIEFNKEKFEDYNDKKFSNIKFLKGY